MFPITGNLRAEVHLTETATYYLPGFTQRLERVEFGRLDGHVQPVILAADGSRVCLFSPDDNSCLFETSLDPNAVDYSICFADVDHDLIPDILIGYYYDAGIFQSDTVCKLEFYGGGSDYNVAESFFFMAEGLSEDSRPPVWSFVELRSLDIDGDNIEELFFSYDRYEIMSIGVEKVLQFTAGQTHLYSTFPETVEWERPVLLSQMEKISPSEGLHLLVANRYDEIALLPGNVTARGWVEIISAGGDSISAVGRSSQPTCVGDSSQLISLCEGLAVGDMNFACEGPEILVRTYYRRTCYTGGEISDEFTDSDIRLYSLGSLPDINLVWTDLSPSVSSNFRFLPQFPGFFFSAEASRIGQHDGLNGELSDLSDQLSADTLIWTDDPDIDGGDLVGIRNQTLSIYEIDISTDIKGEPALQNQPSEFELASPYPNPFNSTCAIDYCLLSRSHIRIEVYNTLGQKVKGLIDDVGAAGRYRVEWDATDLNERPVATGVYLIKMQAGDFVDSKKVLLLK